MFTADGSQTMQASFNITAKKIAGDFSSLKCEQNQNEILILSERTKRLNPKIAFLCLVRSLSYTN